MTSGPQDCRTAHELNSLLDEWLGQADAEPEPTASAVAHLRVGHLLRREFLDGVTALKHFQDAFKKDPARLDAIAAARDTYRELGRLPLVEKLLRIELGGVDEPNLAGPLHRELGDVLADQGDAAGAVAAYREAGGAGIDVVIALSDAELPEEEVEAGLSRLLDAADAADGATRRCELLLRAYRLAVRVDVARSHQILMRAYQTCPEDGRVASLFEGMFVEGDQVEQLYEIQQQLLAVAEDRAALAFLFGARWAHRHIVELAAPLLTEALRESPGLEPAVTYLATASPETQSSLVETAIEVASATSEGEESVIYLVASAALVAWRDLNNIEGAESLRESLDRLVPDHPVLAEFARSESPSELPEEDISVSNQEPKNMDETSKDAAPGEETLNEDATTEAVEARGEGPSEPPMPREEDPAEVAELREKLEAAEKRPHEYVKVLVALGDALGDPDEKLAKYREAAELFSGKFGNHAEAVKVNEKILEVDQSDEEAKAYLREMYEKQRKFDKLLDLMRADADALEPGPEKTEAYREIAQFATDRIKKPDVCVGLWEVVLENDPQDAQALSSLVQLYERARDYEKLADTLEKVVEVTFDEAERIDYLTKLGQIAGDRLKDDERAAEAYRQLLTLKPDDRRAQEQLKKRYVSLGRWEDLELFYQETENWDEFIRLLESNESKAESDEQRIGMLQKVAELWITQKGKPERAARALEKILSVDASNLDAADRLIPIYEQAGNPKGLVGAIEVKLEHTDDPVERLQLLLQAASLYEERLRDKKSALAKYLEAVALDPGMSETLDKAEEVAGQARAWDELEAAYGAAAEQAADPTDAIQLRLRRGRVLSDQLDKTEEALAEYRAVYDEYPDNTEALGALEELYQKIEGWQELLEVYQRKLELVTDPEERKATQFGIARVQREQLEDVTGAITTYEAVRDEDPDDVDALAALDELYGQTEAWEQQSEIIQERVVRAEPDAMVELKFRLAQVQANRLQDYPLALGNYREVLLLDMEHAGARKALEGLLDNTELRGEAAQILETVFEQREDWEKLVMVLEVRADVAADADEQVELLRKLAQISSTRLGSSQDALSAQARALRADPTNGDALIELEELAEQSQALPNLAAIFRKIVEEADDPQLALSYCMRLAALQERLGEVDAAAAAYDKVLEIEPGHEEALQNMDALFRGAERWEELVKVYRKRIELAVDPAVSEELYSQMADVLENRLGQPGEAVSAYQEILIQQPTSQTALKALDHLFTRLERWEDLASNLDAQLVLAETEEESIALTLRLAWVREEKMGHVDAAIDGYREVLERDPNQPDAMAALERLSQSPEYELMVAEILEPLYRNAGEYQKLVAVHEVQVKRSDDPSRKVELLEAIASLYEDAEGNVHAAFDTMARAFAVDPSNPIILDNLSRLAAASDQFAKMGSIVAEQAEQVEDAELSSTLFMTAARVLEDSVGDADQAIELYRKVLTADPMRLEAADALQRLFQATERYADMSAVLQRKAEMLDEPEQQKEALYQAARLEEEILERPDNAIAVYEKALEVDPEDIRSVESLINLFLSLSRWQDLMGAYTRKVDLVFDPEEKKQVLYEVGAVYERELDDVASAIDTYQRVLELDPDDLTALGRLDVLYQTAENWQELLSVLSREAELTADPEEAVGYQFRIAKLYETRLEDVERAVELYRELLAIQPDHEVTLEALENLQRGEKAPLAASAVLEQVYEAANESEKLVGALEVQVQHAADEFAAVDLLQRIANLQEESLGQPEQAFETYCRAISVDSQNLDVLESFERLAMLTESWQRAAEIYDAQLAALEDAPERQVDLGLRVAKVYEIQLEQTGTAIARYRKVVDAEPENRIALEALDRLYGMTEQWAELAEVLAREAEIGETPDEILNHRFRLGQVLQGQLGDLPRAIDAYREVLSAAPEHDESRAALEELFANGVEVLRIAEVLEPLYEASGEWERLIALREGQLAHLVEPQERIALFLQMAEEAEEKLVDVDKAFEVLASALVEAPRNERIADELERLAAALDEGWERLANAYADVLGAEGAPADVIAEIGHRLARVFEEELRDVTKAEETYGFVLSTVPTDLVALENLDRIYTEREHWAALAPILEQRAKVATADFEKIDLYLRLGHTYEEKLAPAGGAAVASTPMSLAPESYDEGVEADLEDEADIYQEGERLEPEEPSLDSLIPEDALESEAPEAYEGAEDVAFPGEDVAFASDEEGRTQEMAPEQLDAMMAQSGSPAADSQTPSVPAAAEYDPERLQDAIRAYRAVFDDLEPENEDAVHSLERCYRRTGEWQKLDEVLQRQLDNAAGDAEESEVRAKRAHLAADHLDNPEAAIEGWKRVLDLRGEDPEALRALAFLYERLGKWSELTDVLERHFDIAESDDDRVHVLIMRARLFDEQLNRDDEALETYQRALDIDYSNPVALRAIASIWRRRKDPEELVTALHALVEQGAAKLEGSELIEAFRELAKLYEDTLERPFDAADAWRNLLEVGPGDFEALDRLEALYRAEEQWVDVIGVKMQRAEALNEPEEQVREFLEVTELWRAPVREYDNAVAAFERVIEIEPLHQKAFKELERLHAGAERWEPLIELYLNRIEHVEEVEDRSDLLRRIAAVFDKELGEQEQAFDALLTAFEEDYFDDKTSEYLERMAQTTNRWNQLITAANGWLKEEQDKKRKIQLCLRLGKWYGEDLGHTEYAMPYYQEVLGMDPNNTRVMRQMASIERLAGNYQKAGQMLQQALDVAVANEDRKAILGDLGDVLYRNLDQVDQAIPFFKRALEVDGGYMPALQALERIYEDRGQIQDLIDILTKKAGAIEKPEDAVRQKIRLGELQEERMNDPEAAAAAYREAVEIDGENLQALRGLERTLGVLEQWQQLVEVLTSQLEVVETERERVDLLVKLADVQEQQFLKADVAAERLEQALQLDPTREEAYVALARCYRRLKQWLDLVGTYQRHIDETHDRETKLELYQRIGEVYRDEVGDLEQAIDAYQAVVDADETNIAALDALSKLFEKQGDASHAIEMMTRVAELTVDGAQQVDMYYRIGRAMEEKLSDRYGAREKFEMALDLDPTHVPSLASLRTIAVDEADWEGACRYLEQEQANTESPRQRARLLVELGKIRDEMLSEHEPAILAYEQAIELDEECEEAALPLVHEYGAQARWADAGPLAEMLARKSKNREKADQQMLQKLLGSVMSHMGEHEKALKAYTVAHQLDLTDAETIRGIADAAYELQDWPTALTNYQKVLTSLGEDEVEQRTDVYWRLGGIKKAQGQDRQAINNYEKALALDGEHRPSLESLVEIYEKAGDNKQVAEHKRQILDSVFDGDERFDLLVEIGDLWADKEKQPLKALEAYEEARDLKPQDHVLLHKMLQNYQAAEEWQKMVDILDAIKEVETRDKLRAKLIYTQAQIYRDKLQDQDRAVELFNEALDLNPELLEAFERINKILTTERNWKQLERSYRKMLHRIAGKGNNQLEHNLWHQLGLIYRDRTGQTQEAIDAFRMSAGLVEEAPMQRKILAELYESTESWDDAIKEQRRILVGDPLNIEPYQALYRLYLHKQAYDEAWCLAAAMSFMNKADAETQQFFEDFRPKGMLQVQGRFGPEHWDKALLHSNVNRHISRIFQAIAPAALQAKVAQLKQQGKLPQPPEQFRQDPATSTVTFAKTFGWASQVLGVEPPALYVRNDVQAYISAVPTMPPASIAGQYVLSGFSPQELTFICGKHLTQYFPGHYMRVLFPTRDELSIMLFAGVLLAAPQQPMPPDMEPQIRATAQSLASYIQPVQMEALKQAVKTWLTEGAKANVKRWNHGVELTACRAGLVLSGDLNIAKKIISAEPQQPGDLEPQEKLKELLIFAVSVEYSALRKVLKVHVNA